MSGKAREVLAGYLQVCKVAVSSHPLSDQSHPRPGVTSDTYKLFCFFSWCGCWIFVAIGYLKGIGPYTYRILSTCFWSYSLNSSFKIPENHLKSPQFMVPLYNYVAVKPPATNKKCIFNQLHYKNMFDHSCDYCLKHIARLDERRKVLWLGLEVVGRI